MSNQHHWRWIRTRKTWAAGLPCSCIFPSVIPSTVAKTTGPMMFIPGTLFCTGSQSSMLPDVLFAGFCISVLCWEIHASTRFGGNIFRSKSYQRIDGWNVLRSFFWFKYPDHFLHPVILITKMIPNITATNSGHHVIHYSTHAYFAAQWQIERSNSRD